MGEPNYTEYLTGKFARNVAPIGSAGHILTQDANTNDTIVINHVHEEIHAGNKFVASDLIQGVGATTSTFYLLITPNTTTRIHMLFEVEATVGVITKIFEGATTTANGTSIPAFNQRRTSANLPTLQIFSGPTITINGTQIFVEEIGSPTAPTRAVGRTSGDRDEDEWILAQNTKYLLFIQTGSSVSTDITSIFGWYEL